MNTPVSQYRYSLSAFEQARGGALGAGGGRVGFAGRQGAASSKPTTNRSQVIGTRTPVTADFHIDRSSNPLLTLQRAHARPRAAEEPDSGAAIPNSAIGEPAARAGASVPLALPFRRGPDEIMTFDRDL